jgi:radical SAM protein with 4Fe4S-binding SPASM domain
MNKYPPCSWPWRQCNIAVNGDVNPCCGGLPPMGNIYEKPFEEIWNSERYMDLRATVNTSDRWPACRKCHYLTSAVDINNIETHLTFLKGRKKPPGREELKPDLLDYQGPYSIDERLHDRIWEGYIADKASGGPEVLEEIRHHLRDEERDYLGNKVSRATEMSSDRFLVLMVRLLNRFDHAYVAYRLIKEWAKSTRKKDRASLDLYKQVITENFYSELRVGYLQSASASFKTVSRLLPEAVKHEITRMISTRDFSGIMTSLDGYLESHLDLLMN